MRLRTFNAPDMPTAMQLVRDALGEDAVILSSQAIRGKGVNVTAAIEEEPQTDDREPIKIKGQKHSPAPERLSAAEPIRFHLQEVLRFHNIPELFIARMLQKAAPDSSPTRALEKMSDAFFSFDPLALQDSRSNRIMLIGPPGIGKTLTIAKLAAAMTLQSQEPIVVTTDTKRAGGVEQLQAFTDILGLKLKVASTQPELSHHLNGRTRPALIDTAGCNPYDPAEFRELASFASLSGIEPVLVLPAGGDSLEAVDMVEPFMRLPVKRLLVTRTDTTRRFGGVIAAAAAHALAFCNISGSSSPKEPLKAADGKLMAQLLLKYRE